MARAGLFFSDRTGEPLRLIVQHARLRFVGGPPLTPVAPDRFRRQGRSLEFRSSDQLELHFASNDELHLTSDDGRATRYRRAGQDPRLPAGRSRHLSARPDDGPLPS